jgi:sialic acid synthase SpsE
MTGDDVARVVRAIRDLQMMPLATPFSPSDLDLVDRLRLPAIKIASPDLVNRPLLSEAAKLNKPLLVSTGAAELEEIDTAVGWMKEWNSSVALLHCISSYPAAHRDANLGWIPELAQRYGVPIGYSDHTTSPMAGGFATSAGASIVEKHLTYDRSARGPDHAASADPTQFMRYVKLIREADLLRGTPGKRVLDAEQDVRKVSRQSLVLRRSLKAGERIREEDLTVQRPGAGVPAAQVQLAIGRMVKASVTAGTMLQWDMLDAA